MRSYTRTVLVTMCGVLELTLVSGCSMLDSGAPIVAAAIDDAENGRTVTVYLVADPASGFLPVYQDRVITAEPVTVSNRVRAEARRQSEGITTVIIGDSCDALRLDYADVQECQEVESVTREYGGIESTASTDREGFASLEIGAGEYRISMKTWKTREDTKCSWSGSETLAASSRVLELPVLVFCE